MEKSWLLAGGQDSYDWFKDRAKRPEALIDITGIAALKGVRETADGLEIGALTTLTEIAENEAGAGEVQPCWRAPPARVASPQIRNAGTLGGNLCQDARCWYYRAGVDCYRAGGNTCYADTPQGQNREHCLFGAARCIAVTPSDVAPAVVALEGAIVIAGGAGRARGAGRGILHRSGGGHHAHDHPQARRSRHRGALAEEMGRREVLFREGHGPRHLGFRAGERGRRPCIIDGGTIKDARIVCGAVECVPRRLKAVEQAVIGQPQNEDTALIAGRTASQGATAGAVQRLQDSR